MIARAVSKVNFLIIVRFVNLLVILEAERIFSLVWILSMMLSMPHTARKVFNSFQTLLNHIQGCVGCQMKGKTSIDMNLVVFCAKIQVELKNLQKCGKDTKICTFFEVFHTFSKFSPILAQNTLKIIFIKVFCYF